MISQDTILDNTITLSPINKHIQISCLEYDEFTLTITYELLVNGDLLYYNVIEMSACDENGDIELTGQNKTDIMSTIELSDEDFDWQLHNEDLEKIELGV